jgi:hypothetical protein
MKFTIEYINQKGGNIKNVYKRGGSIAKNIELEPLEELKDVYYIKCTEKNSENVCKQISKEEFDKDEQNINLININITKIKDENYPLIDQKDLDHFNISESSESITDYFFGKKIDKYSNLSLIGDNLYNIQRKHTKKNYKEYSLRGKLIINTDKYRNLSLMIKFFERGHIDNIANHYSSFIPVRKENDIIEIYDKNRQKYYNFDIFLNSEVDLYHEENIQSVMDKTNLNREEAIKKLGINYS